MIGPPGVGKSTIMNEIYGFDATSPGNIRFLCFVSLRIVCSEYMNCLILEMVGDEMQKRLCG